jgi:hypothetical protein
MSSTGDGELGADVFERKVLGCDARVAVLMICEKQDQRDRAVYRATVGTTPLTRFNGRCRLTAA